MPTATTNSAKPAAAKARKATARKAARPRSAASAKASRAKASRTRAVSQAQSAAKTSDTAARETAGVFGDYAERVVLIPVGAALIARDRVVSSVSETLATYSSGTRTQAQLRRFERRGLTARKRLEREVRKARVRVERELRQRRRVLGNTLSDTVNEIEGRRESLTRNGSDIAKRVPELADQVQERILSLV